MYDCTCLDKKSALSSKGLYLSYSQGQKCIWIIFQYGQKHNKENSFKKMLSKVFSTSR